MLEKLLPQWNHGLTPSFFKKVIIGHQLLKAD